ncbi:APC family permease [Nonomuraea composti]|nr:APC family permease [Nonomuraea sp. FMUSA5-5]
MSATPLPRRREPGPWTATALVVGNMIGSGAFPAPATATVRPAPV